MSKGFYGAVGSWENASGVRFKTFGRWDETLRMLQKLRPAIKNASVAAQLIVCNEICTRVRNHIIRQDLPWVPLSQNYANKKSRRGLDSRVMIAWGSYYDAIKVWRHGNQHMVFVGVKKGVYGKTPEGKRGKLEISQIAAIHEFSADPKKRRPLWNPTIQEMGGMRGLKVLYLTNLFKQLRKRHIPVNYTKGNHSINIEGKIFSM